MVGINEEMRHGTFAFVIRWDNSMNEFNKPISTVLPLNASSCSFANLKIVQLEIKPRDYKYDTQLFVLMFVLEQKRRKKNTSSSTCEEIL